LADFLKKHAVKQQFGSAYNSTAQAIVERFNLTLRMGLRGVKGHWSENLPSVINSYNNSYHSTIKMTPFEAYFYRENQQKVYNTIMKRAKKLIAKTQSTKSYKVGDVVKTIIYSKENKKSTRQIWSDENYTIVGIDIVPPLGLKYFTLKDSNGRVLQKKYNVNQILKV